MTIAAKDIPIDPIEKMKDACAVYDRLRYAMLDLHASIYQALQEVLVAKYGAEEGLALHTYIASHTITGLPSGSGTVKVFKEDLCRTKAR